MIFSFKLNDHVRVRLDAVKPQDGRLHPHRGMTGHITEFFVLSFPQSAMVERDDKTGFNRVTIDCLEKIDDTSAG